MSDPPTETELKFLIAPEQVGDLLSHRLVKGRMKKVRLRSIYFDTPDNDLGKAGISLRVRSTGHAFVQTVKTTKAGASRRGEWESSVKREAVDHAALARTPAAEVLNGNAGSLLPIFSTTLERRSRLVRYEGAQIEVSVDHGELSSEEASEPIEELELELKTGEISSLFGLAHELCRTTPIRLSFDSKAERGHRLKDGAAADPRKAQSVELSAAMSSMEAFQAIASACLAQITSNAELLRRIRRPEALHQLRIGLRRLRTATSLFKTMLADDECDTIGQALKWLSGELDSARDIEVFGNTTFLNATKESATMGLPELGRHLLKAKRKAYDRALAAVESERYATLVLQVAAWIEAGAWTQGENPVLAHLRSVPVTEHRIAALDHLRHAVRKRGRTLERVDPKARHKLRIRAKRLRYAIEFFSSLSAHHKREAKFLATLKTMQDQLGELNDIVVARERLLIEGSLKDPAVAFTAGRAIGRRERDEPRLIHAATKSYRAFDKAAPFWR